jgi:hypothetical protein
MISTLRAILRTEGWQHFAYSEAKGATFLWLIVGGIYQLWNGRLLSLPTILLFFPGIFVASFAQILPAMVNAVKTVRLTEVKAGLRRVRLLEMLWWTVWYLFNLMFVPALAVLSMRMLDAIL